MALPIITIHDVAGDLIPTGTPLVLPTATPGTPGAPVTFRVSNNSAAGPAVDPSLNTKVDALGKLLGGPGEVGSDLQYLVEGAFELSVTAVSGGATAQLGGFQPQGGGRALSISTIPDGGEVELAARTSASLGASSTNVALSITVESTQSTPGAGPEAELESLADLEELCDLIYQALDDSAPLSAKGLGSALERAPAWERLQAALKHMVAEGTVSSMNRPSARPGRVTALYSLNWDSEIGGA